MDQIGAHGPLARALGALKGGTFWNIILSQSIEKIEGGHFGEKNSKKVSQCRKGVL